MSILKNLRFDRVCGRAAAAMGVCVGILLLCGAFRDSIAASVIGDIAACVIISLYACAFAYAACNALAEEAAGYGEFVLRSGHIVCASCAAAQAVKLFFLLLPCQGAELAGGVVLIADAAISWIFPMIVVRGRRAAFLASVTDKLGVASGSVFEKKIFGRY